MSLFVFGDEKYDNPIPIELGSSSSSGSAKYANVQFNITPVHIQLNVVTSGDKMYIEDSITAENKFNKKETNGNITINDDNLVVTVANQYYHDIMVSFTVSGTSGIRTVLCQIVDDIGNVYTDDTHYSIIETNGDATRYEFFLIKTFIEHNANDVVRLQFTSSESGDIIIIKQIKWVIL